MDCFLQRLIHRNMRPSPVPIKDTWGVLMRKDSPLAEKETISPEDLWDKPLIVSHQKGDDVYLNQWLQREASELHIVATYNLLFNASLLVSEGLGYALCFDRLINTQGSSLCFRPFSPPIGSAGAHRLEKISGVFQSGAVSFCNACGSCWRWKCNSFRFRPFRILIFSL